LPVWPPDQQLRLEILPERDIVVDPGAVVFRLVHEGPATTTGYDVDGPVAERVEEAVAVFGPAAG
jgi:hypothetical protein